MLCFVAFQCIFIFLQMEWRNRERNDGFMKNTNTTTSTFLAAEEFARYLYHQWTTTTTANNNNNNNTTIAIQNSSMSSNSQDTAPHIYPMLLFIAKDDQMVYIARPIHNNRQHTIPTTHPNDGGSYSSSSINDRIASILTTTRLEHLLLQHMMTHLQQQQYVPAIQEFLSGIDFYMKYGPPKVFIWEHILLHTWFHTNHNFHEQIYQMFIMLLITMAFICINWYPLLQLYDRYLYHNVNDYYHGWYQNHSHWWLFTSRQMKIAVPPLSEIEYNRAEELRQKYHVQDSCPICLERFTKGSPTTTTTTTHTGNCRMNNDDIINDDTVYRLHSPPLLYPYGSDHQPITLLRCGHVYDTSCWSKWMIHHYHQNQQNQQPHPSKLKCLICQQPVQVES